MRKLLIFILTVTSLSVLASWFKKPPKMPPFENPYSKFFTMYDCKTKDKKVSIFTFKCKVKNLSSKRLPGLIYAKNYDKEGVILRTSMLGQINDIPPNSVGYIEFLMPKGTDFIIIELDEAYQ